MQPLESAMLVILAISLLIPLIPLARRPSWLRMLQLVGPVCVAIVFQLHAALEGPRTEMIAVYALGFVLLLVAGLRFLAGRGRPDSALEQPSTALRAVTISASLAGIALLVWTVHSIRAGA
jgi:hypothetical protein